MTDTKADLKQDAAATENAELPLIEKVAPVMAATFAPNQLDMPNANDLANILMITGMIRLGPIAGEDKQGNLVSTKGEVVIPVQLRRFFVVQEVQTNG